MKEKIEIKKLDENDIENVFELEKTFFPVTEKKSILDALKSDTLFYFSIFVDDIFVGFMECSVVLDEAELYEIAIKKEYQGKGLSKLLMNFLFDFLREKNVRTIFLEVNKINNKAISLYNKFGFCQYSVRKNYYGDNDAILMKCDVKF